MDENYNLLEEKWIPVLWNDGNTSCVGIIEALTEIGQVRQIAVVCEDSAICGTATEDES